MAVLTGPITFETGDLTEWTSTVSGTNYALSASTDAEKNGTYGMRAEATSTSDTNGGAGGLKTFTASPALTVADAWFRFTTWTNSGYNGTGSKSILEIGDSGVGFVAWLAIRGTRMVELCYRDTGFSTVASGQTLTLDLNVWYLIRVIHDKAGSLVFKYSTDGTNFTTIGTVASGVRGDDINEIRAGIVHVNQWEQASYTVDVDDITVYDAEPSGSQQYSQSVSGALTSAGAATKQARRTQAGSLSTAGATARRAGKRATGSLTSAGALVKQGRKRPAGALASSGALNRQSRRALVAALATGGGVTRRTSKNTAGTLGSTGVLAALRTVLLALAGALGLSGAISRRTNITETGVLTSAGAATKQTRRTVAGTLSTSATLNSIRTFLRSVAGALGTVGALVKRTSTSEAGALGSAGTVAKQMRSAMSGVLGMSGAATKRIALGMAGAVGVAGVVAKVARKGLAGVLAFVGVVGTGASETRISFRGGLRARDAKLSARDASLRARNLDE